jgi:RNA polymerase sigma-70 factor (ECF subfamily)
VNLARDELRRRKRRRYAGPWLPAPLETEPFADLLPLPGAVEPRSTEQRYELLESVSFAFLLALEALTPTQRAALLLQDVLDYSARETAEALGCSEANARTLLHRARKTMAAYDRARFVPSAALRESTRELLGRFLTHIALRDAEALEALLAEDVVFMSDSGGEFAAAIVPVHGPARVADLQLRVARADAMAARVADLNGVPALIAEYAHEKPRHARRFALLLGVNADGRIGAVHAVLESGKLRSIRFPDRVATA